MIRRRLVLVLHLFGEARTEGRRWPAAAKAAAIDAACSANCAPSERLVRLHDPPYDLGHGALRTSSSPPGEVRLLDVDIDVGGSGIPPYHRVQYDFLGLLDVTSEYCGETSEYNAVRGRRRRRVVVVVVDVVVVAVRSSRSGAAAHGPHEAFRYLEVRVRRAFHDLKDGVKIVGRARRRTIVVGASVVVVVVGGMTLSNGGGRQ
mmetsp:Transcript_30254/g.90100  ORF Transcript_30254/g.90100 Transcript_30254/m.90100 type:complete len:204 (-) Transcript_30254:71-682(-)